VVGPSVTIQVDQNLINPGQSIAITVIARSVTGIDWIEFDAIESDNNENGNDDSSDPARVRQRLDCDWRTERANICTVSPSAAGRYTLRARGEGKDDAPSE
jgi:hypothetical protein